MSSSTSGYVCVHCKTHYPGDKPKCPVCDNEDNQHRYHQFIIPKPTPKYKKDGLEAYL